MARSRSRATTPSPQPGILRRLGRYLNFLAPVALFSLGANLLMLGLPLYSMQIYDRVLPTRSIATLVVLSFLILAMILAVLLLDVIRGRLMVQFSAKVSTGLSDAALYGSLRGGQRADYGTPATDLDTVRRSLSSPIALAVFDAPWALIAIVVIFGIHPYLGAISALGALLLVVTGVSISLWTRRAQSRLRKIDRRIGATITDFGRENGALRAMGGVDEVETQLLSQRGERLDLDLRAGYASAFARSVSRGLRSTLLLFSLGIAAWLAVQQTVAPGAVIAVSLLLARAFGPLEQVSSGWFHLVDAARAWHRLELLSANIVQRQKTRLPEVAGHLCVTDVALRCGEGTTSVFRGLRFDVAEGETLAIVGPVGAGKSTLCRLLSGIQAPTVGEIRLDGASLTDWPPEQWGRSIGYVPQEFQLFNGTVAENIARFSDVDDGAVMEAARLAGAHEQILRLPQGYDTPLGDPDLHLSSGERQMIGLARAYYRKPRYIVLDEPTFHLDDAGENQLASALHELKSEGCTLVLASRSAALLHLADHLLVLQRGRPATFTANASIAEALRPRLAVEPETTVTPLSNVNRAAP